MEENAATSGAEAVLDTSAADTVTLEGAASTATVTPEQPKTPEQTTEPSDPQARINNLMSSWQREQAEVTKLQGLVATTTAENVALKEKLADLESGKTGAETAAGEQVKEASAKVAELEAQIATLTADNAKLQVLVENPDLAAYRDILPVTGDKAALDRAISTIRGARDAETTRLRDALTMPRGGSQIPRGSLGAMTSDQISAYLLNGGPAHEFEKRLAELTGK